MQFEWQYEDSQCTHGFNFFYNGIFISQKDTTNFYCENVSDICTSDLTEWSFDHNGNLLCKKYYDTHSESIPALWMHSFHKNNSYILLNRHSAFDTIKKIIIYDDPDLVSIYNQKYGNPYHFFRRFFCF